MFSKAQTTLQMYSVMAIFKSSIVCGLFEYTEFFIAPQRKKSGRERSRDLGGQIVVEHLVYIPQHTETHVPLGTYTLQQIIPLSQHTSFLPHYLAQSDCLVTDRQGQGETRLTLTPSVIPNSNYVIMVSD
jgi:hypothetical protein